MVDDHRKKLSQTIQIKAKKIMSSQIVKQPFRIVTITLLSLLVPLSFLLLARLSCARFLLSLANDNIIIINPHYNDSNFFSVFLFTNPAPLYFLVSIISVSTLVQTLSTGKLIVTTSLLNDHERRSPRPPSRLRLRASWIFLCALQVCVGAGINGGVAGLGTDFSGLIGAVDKSGTAAALFSKVIFFVGLHETMHHWCRTVVRPVVDDTVPHNYGCGSSPLACRVAEKWARRGAMAGGFGSLWYWRLRDEVEALVAAAEVRGEMLMGVGLGDFAGWWLYYLTVTVGMVRVVKGLMWLGMSLFRARVISNIDNSGNDHGSSGLVLVVSDNYDHHQQQQVQTCLDVDDDHDHGLDDGDEKVVASSNADVC